MNIDIRRLNSNIDPSVPVDISYTFSEKELEGTELINCTCQVKGEIYKNITDELAINLNIKGIMILPCAVTLKPVEYPFDINIDDEFNEICDNLNKN